MNAQTASAMTWSMTATGRKPLPLAREVKCGHCGSTFKAVSLKAKYCSDACRIDAHKRSQGKRKPKICAGCGVEFAPAWSKQTFCNAACRSKKQGRAYRGRRLDGGINRNGKADQLDFAPDAVDGVPSWVASAEWGVVERTWVGVAEGPRRRPGATGDRRSHLARVEHVGGTDALRELEARGEGAHAATVKSARTSACRTSARRSARSTEGDATSPSSIRRRWVWVIPAAFATEY